jgi:8-oxo-dGTP diphosphatase
LGVAAPGDAISDIGIVVARRAKPPYGISLLGGYVEVGESAEASAAREVEEECGLRLESKNFSQLHFFSDPRRDPRRAGGSLLLTQILPSDFVEANLQRDGDETYEVQVVPLRDCIAGLVEFAFPDHGDMVRHFFVELEKGAIEIPADLGIANEAL